MQRHVLIAAISVLAARRPAEYVVEPAKQIPLVMDADVVVVGGLSAAVQAACAAADRGARVTYLTGCMVTDVLQDEAGRVAGVKKDFVLQGVDKEGKAYELPV